MSGAGGQPVLEYGRPERKSRRVVWVLLIVGGLFVVAFLFAILGPSIRNGAIGDRVRSASNLRQIGNGIAIYSNENGGAFPDSMRTLYLRGWLPSAVFVSPLGSDTPAVGATTRATADQLMAGGHNSYVYLGKGLTSSTVTPDMILAYEQVPASAGGMNVLFGDYHVEWVGATRAAKIISAVGTGVFPVTMPSN